MRTHTHRDATYQISDAHPAAEAMPWAADGDDFNDLVESMRTHGFDLARPILRTGDGRIIGGRRRELAAIIAGVAPVYQTREMTDAEIVAWVEREDLLRRHLTPSQRAAAVTALATLAAHGTNRFHLENKAKPGQPAPETTARLAGRARVGTRTIEEVRKVRNKAPELLPAVKEGELSANTAAKIADLPKPARKRVIAADDPKTQAKIELRDATPEASPADDFCGLLNALCKDLDAIGRRIAELKESPFAFCVHWQSAQSQVKAARETLHGGRPAHDCPYCQKAGKIQPDCRSCRGTGRVTKGSHKAGVSAVGGEE